MKFFKINLLFSFFFLISLASFSNKKNIADVLTKFNIQQSPLADDETNPINLKFIDFSEFDLEDTDESNYTFTYIKVNSTIDSRVISYLPLTPTFLFSNRQHPHFATKHTLQSYLQVFQI